MVCQIKMALTIATSDSGGGAGIQADLKTFAALKVFGLSVISAVTAQNTMEVKAMENISPSVFLSQLEAIFDDLPPLAIKIGLLGNAENAKVLLSFLKTHKNNIPVILDPVMVSTSGHLFLEPSAISALKELFSIVDLLTPNKPEAENLTGLSLKTPDDFIEAAVIIRKMGVKSVLVKGGHASEKMANDLLLGPNGALWLESPRVPTINNHGTGCTLSSAIAAYMALGKPLIEAVSLAKNYVFNALNQDMTIGKGPGPLHHFFNYYSFS